MAEADDTLARWQARGDEVTARTGGAGIARPDQLAGRAGLDLFQSQLRGEFPAAPIGVTLDFTLVEVAFGKVQFQGRPGRAHYNPLGTVHGGWIATLLDSALGCSVHTALPAGKLYTTLELKVNYIRALTDRVPLVRAVGQTIHVGGRTATAEARLVGADGTLFAHATTTCLVFDAPTPRGAPP